MAYGEGSDMGHKAQAVTQVLHWVAAGRSRPFAPKDAIATNYSTDATILQSSRTLSKIESLGQVAEGLRRQLARVAIRRKTYGGSNPSVRQI